MRVFQGVAVPVMVVDVVAQQVVDMGEAAGAGAPRIFGRSGMTAT
jgi:hypothetical protein